MPNWTSNVLDVTGKGAYAFKRLVYSARKIKGTINTEFHLEKTIPMPKELEGTSSPTDKPNKRLLKKYGSDNWYDWQLENWGCKWGACHTQDAQKIAGGYRFLFDTPWAPPVTWMIATARKFPDLTLKDTWQGDGGDGQAIITIHGEDVNEEVLSNHEYNMEYDDDYREEYQFITEGAYDAVIKKFVEEEANFSALHEYLLERIKDEDLPLFINFEWGNVNDKFTERLKGKA